MSSSPQTCNPSSESQVLNLSLRQPIGQGEQLFQFIIAIVEDLY